MRYFCLLASLLTILMSPCKALADDFTLQSEDFADKSIIPVVHTCDGSNTPPQFSWQNPPANTKSFAIVLSDKSEKKYYWIYYNIPEKTDKLDDTKLAVGIIGSNSLNKKEYDGPCPPKGGMQTYTFSLYSLNNTLTVNPNENADNLVKAIEHHSLQKTELTAIYSRWPNATSSN